ncbi:hypothetical protein [Sphingomonas morindae]|uniref:Uncharacterized protein n=1 Tax=Sphingomonas morindae TaxID=1541170 RepID=A0ABY4XB52_9SPHN|nr:hypothetical protein [Sphingomonas morindae]USI73940.1 hypothetical protein LHA26_05595 [Sphingomonas morindae]
MPKLPIADARIALRYAQLEELIANFLDVHADRRTALTARLRLFRHKRFPPGLKAESRSRFSYDLDAVIHLLVAFQLLDGLVPQESVPTLLEARWSAIRAAFGRAFDLTALKGSEAAGIDPERDLLIVRPRNLLSFSQPRQEDTATELPALSEVMSARDFERHLRRSDVDGLSPRLVIDLQRIASWLREALLAARWASPESFEAAPSDE